MEEIRCTECGEMLVNGTKECPKCGCPVNYLQPEIKKEEITIVKSDNGENKKTILPIISLVIGVVIVIMGFMLLTHKSNIEVYDARIYDVDKVAFGADFYTEIYNASDTIVDELNDINGGIAVISNSLASVIEAIYYGGGMVVIALGLGIVAISFMNINKSRKWN